MNRLFFLLILFPMIMQAQSKKPHSVTIEVVAQDSVTLRNAELEIQVYTEGMNSDYAKNIQSYARKADVSRTSFKIPLDSGIAYGRIFYHIKGTFAGNLLRPPKNLFLFQSGDSIQVHVGNNKVIFTGRGSEKYNCLYQLHSLSRSAVLNIPPNTGMSRTEAEIRYDLQQEDSLYTVRLAILKSYQLVLSPMVYELILADLFGIYHEALIDGLFRYIGKELRDPETDLVVSRIYGELELARHANRFTEDQLASSFSYVDFLYKKLRFSAYFYLSPQQGHYNRNYKFSELYDLAKQYPNSKIEDKLITLLFADKMNWEQDARDKLPDALSSMSDIHLKSFLLRLKEHGEIAFPFELPDVNGRIHKLSDYKGKLILMDFWFTGCTACKILAKQMQPVRSFYKDNKEVVFISISINGDRYKDMWLKNVEDEVYSSKEDVNLLAQGRTADIIKYYHITGYPVLILISKTGKVISTAPPKPGTLSPSGKDVMIEFLNQYL